MPAATQYSNPTPIHPILYILLDIVICALTGRGCCRACMPVHQQRSEQQQQQQQLLVAIAARTCWWTEIATPTLDTHWLSVCFLVHRLKYSSPSLPSFDDFQFHNLQTSILITWNILYVTSLLGSKKIHTIDQFRCLNLICDFPIHRSTATFYGCHALGL